MSESNNESASFHDDFRGDDAHLVRSIQALLALDAHGALVPHGVGGHGRSLLSAAAARLDRAFTSTLREIALAATVCPEVAGYTPSQVIAHLTVELSAARDRLAGGHPVATPSAPERIYLVIGEDELPEGTDFNDLKEVCWCADSQFDTDIAYIRADLAAPAPAPPAALTNIRRFDMDMDGIMDEFPDGRWARYDDVATLLAAQPAEPEEDAEGYRNEWNEALQCHERVRVHDVQELIAAEDARASRQCQCGFDAWQENPYTKVLQKSIREDYVPKADVSRQQGALSDERLEVILQGLEDQGFDTLRRADKEDLQAFADLFASSPRAEAQAVHDVLAERRRQVEVEGWTPEHDDEHSESEMSLAAACYAMAAGGYAKGQTPPIWPWALEGWKPSYGRRDLIKAGALILAEIERIDRLAAAEAPNKESSND